MLTFLAKAPPLPLILWVGLVHAQTPMSEATGRMYVAPAARLDQASLDQIRVTRAESGSQEQRHSFSNQRLSRRGAIPGPDRRAELAHLPAGARSPVVVSPHATDPGAPRQAMTRSAPKNMRAPVAPSPERGEPTLAPRMSFAHDTRKTRASFRDWLFGR